MTTKQRIGLSLSVLLLAALFVFIIFSERGLMDLRRLRAEQQRLVEKSRYLEQQNHTMRIEIERLKYDPQYIESVARRELGMVGRHEVILKPRQQPAKKVPE